jgi:TonB family protein
MRTVRLAVLGLATAATLTFAAEVSGKAREPTGPWNVQTGSNECLLMRSYGTPTNPLYLALSQSPMEQGAQLTILYKRDRRSFGQGRAEVSFNDGPPIIAKYGTLLLVNNSAEIRTKTLRSITLSDEARQEPEPFFRDASSVSINVPKEIKATFALPDHASALKALRDCAANLGVEWGYPLNEQARMAKAARRENGLDDLFTPDDYPAAAQKRGEMGRVRIRIRVSPTGDPSDCTVLGSSGSADLDSTTCNIIRSRAKFEPAIDVDGKPVRSVYVSTINWLLIG